MLKTCKKCDSDKPPGEFHRDRRSRDGRCSICKPCAKAKSAQWRSKNTERYREYDRNRYSDEKRAHCREYNRRRHSLDPMYGRLNEGAHRARVAGAVAHRVTTDELLADWERRGIDPARCVYTGEPLQAGWHLDHAVPLAHPNTPGHVVTNLVPSNPFVNRSKNSRHWVEFLADRAEAERG